MEQNAVPDPPEYALRRRSCVRQPVAGRFRSYRSLGSDHLPSGRRFV